MSDQFSTSPAPPATPSRRSFARGAMWLIALPLFLEFLFYVATWWFQIAPLVLADPSKGWRLAPSAKIPLTNEEGPYVFDVNSEGRRDAHRFAPKTADRHRILVFGGSNTVGVSVPTDDVYTQVLERILPACEVINVGCVLYELDQQVVLMKEIASDWKPDIVLHAINDDTHAYIFAPYEPRIGLPRCHVRAPSASAPVIIEPPTFPWWQPIASKSALVSTFDLLLYRRSHQAPTHQQTPALAPEQEPTMKHLILTARDQARQSGARYIAFTTQPDSPTFRTTTTIVHELAEAGAIDAIRLHLNRPDEAIDNPAAVLKEDPGHWSVLGHFLVAEQLKVHLETILARP